LAGKPLVFTKHAQDMIDERKIPLAWIKHVLQNLVFEEPDWLHRGATRAYAPIVAFGSRMLRGVYL
jgi:hypothetical protein